MRPPADGDPGRLVEAMRYSLLAPGQADPAAAGAWPRPRRSGRVDDDVRLACAAVELVHCYSLIHDDLPAMDDDDFRRGRPSNHKVFGEATAILAGDALLTLAFEWIAEAGVRSRTARSVTCARGARAGARRGRARDGARAGPRSRRAAAAHARRRWSSCTREKTGRAVPSGARGRRLRRRRGEPTRSAALARFGSRLRHRLPARRRSRRRRARRARRRGARPADAVPNREACAVGRAASARRRRRAWPTLPARLARALSADQARRSHARLPGACSVYHRFRGMASGRAHADRSSARRPDGRRKRDRAYLVVLAGAERRRDVQGRGRARPSSAAARRRRFGSSTTASRASTRRSSSRASRIVPAGPRVDQRHLLQRPQGRAARSWSTATRSWSGRRRSSSSRTTTTWTRSSRSRCTSRPCATG